MARWLIALVIALISLFTYFGSTSVNPLTGEKQRVGALVSRSVAAQSPYLERQPEFFSTHPHPENREARIREEIAKRTAK